MRLVYTNFGNGIALGAYGEKEKIEQFFTFLYNFGATESSPHFLSDKFAYVLTTWPGLSRGLEQGIVTDFVREHIAAPREERKDVWPQTVPLVQQIMQSVALENFLGDESIGETYSLSKDHDGKRVE